MLAPNSKSNSNRPTESSRCLYEPRRDPGKDATESRNERPYPEPEVDVNAMDGKETKCALECHVLKAI